MLLIHLAPIFGAYVHIGCAHATDWTVIGDNLTSWQVSVMLQPLLI